DPNGVDAASARCVRLLSEWSGGRPAAGAIDAYPAPAQRARIVLHAPAARRLLRIPVSVEQMGTLLQSIELDAKPGGAGPLRVEVPTFRRDLVREVDLIEEVARLHGYDAFPPTLPPSTHAPRGGGDAVAEAARDGLCALGLAEAITYGFVAPERIEALGLPASD